MLLCLPGMLLAADWPLGGLGARPLDAAIHETGTWAIRLLLATLAVTPARHLLRHARLIGLRRMIGVAALAYALAHVALYGADQSLDLRRIALEVTGRFYLTIGLAALLVIAALGATSTDAAIRRLGSSAWRRLHRLVYPAAALALAHHALQSKLAISEPVMLAGLFVWLLGWRALHRRRADDIAALIGLSLAACLATAALEAGWYAAATGVDARAVIWANLAIDLAPRPAVLVMMAGLAAVLVSWVAGRYASSQSIALRARS